MNKSETHPVAVCCCSVVQLVCSVLPCIVTVCCCSGRVAVRCSVLQGAVVCYSMLQRVDALCDGAGSHLFRECMALQGEHIAFLTECRSL